MNSSADRQIIVIKLGWVLVGRVSTDTPEQLGLTNAHVIRTWGTSKGLGELAEKGPLKTSVLEPAGIVDIQKSAILFRINCEPKSWSKLIP